MTAWVRRTYRSVGGSAEFQRVTWLLVVLGVVIAAALVTGQVS